MGSQRCNQSPRRCLDRRLNLKLQDDLFMMAGRLGFLHDQTLGNGRAERLHYRERRHRVDIYLPILAVYTSFSRNGEQRRRQTRWIWSAGICSKASLGLAQAGYSLAHPRLEMTSSRTCETSLKNYIRFLQN
jgi:hypothetical protein